MIDKCSPRDEQRRIVTYLDSLQAKVNALRELQSASGGGVVRVDAEYFR